MICLKSYELSRKQSRPNRIRVLKKADHRLGISGGLSASCVKDGFLALALPRLAVETTEWEQAVKDFFKSLPRV